MMRSILIDPYMFELSDIQEIKNNISFFQTMIRLCRKTYRNSEYNILFYKGIIEKIRNRHINPFPINLSIITDKELKETLLQLNYSFNIKLLNSIEEIDIDQCSGYQEFDIIGNDSIKNDNNYYEMLCVLLIPCYRKIIQIDNKIATGIKKEGQQIDDCFEIRCKCSEYAYTNSYRFSEIKEFLSDQDKAIDELRIKIKSGEIKSPIHIPAEMGDHHNMVQSSKKKFKELDDLSFDNKRVLKILTKLGLSKVLFKEYHPYGLKKYGTMKIIDVENKSSQDIVTVKFNAETDFQIETDLYFPKDIGSLLYKYFKADLITYQNINDLIEKI